jgi:hypothetical protein
MTTAEHICQVLRQNSDNTMHAIKAVRDHTRLSLEESVKAVGATGLFDMTQINVEHTENRVKVWPTDRSHKYFAVLVDRKKGA